MLQTLNGGVNLGINSFTDCRYTADLAWFISNYPDKFLDASVEEIFSINQIERWGTTSSGKWDNTFGLGVATVQGTADIYYPSTMCLYHSSGNKLDYFAIKMENIIEFESPGIITVHKFTGEAKWSGIVGNSTKEGVEMAYESQTLDFTSEESAKNLYINKMGGTEDTFDHAKMKQDISAFAYLLYQSTLTGEYNSNVAGSNLGLTPIKKAMLYWWASNSNQNQMLRYCNASGLMNSIFENEVGGISFYEKDYTEEGKEKSWIAVAKEAVANMNEAIPSITKEKSNPTIEYKNQKAYIGPLQVTYSGGTPVITVEGKEVKWVTKDNNGGYSSEINSNQLTSGQVFYVVVDENTAKVLTEVKVEIKVNYDKYRARMVLASNKASGGQNLLNVAGEKESATTDPVTWEVQVKQEKEITIQKQDASGNNLSVEGIQFKVYDSKGQTVGTLVTEKNGKTEPLKLKIDETYTIEETYNTAYGYRGCDITGATITPGTGTISVNNGKITIKNITEDSTIFIKNTPQLGNLTVVKYGRNKQLLESVRFVIAKAGKFIKLNDASVTTPIKTDVDVTKYNVQYVDSAAEATKFETNSEGKIVIENLEVYRAPGKKYEYNLYETKNSNYGYEEMNMRADEIIIPTGTTKQYPSEDIENDCPAVDIQERRIKFELGNNTSISIEIYNTPKLSDLKIIKVGQTASGKVNVEDVEFIIEREAGKYIQLIDNNDKVVTSVKGKAIINSNNKAVAINDTNEPEYRVTYISDKAAATKFITNANGEIAIRNIQMYGSGTIEYSYTAHEVSNPNYGYGSTKNANIKKTVTDLVLNGESKIELDNTQELANIEIEKVGKTANGEAKLENVEFIIQRGTNEYLQLKDSSDKPVLSIKGSATINNKNKATSEEYSVTYISNREQATKFITDSNGKTGIKNVEINKTSTSKYSYTAHETSNPNYGYGSNQSANIKETIIDLVLNGTTRIEIDNTQGLSSIEIEKVGEKETKLEGVEFIIQRGTNEYLQLKNSSGKVQDSIKGTATINSNNVANTAEYSVAYVSDQTKATKFITDSNGKTKINNIETDKTATEKYSYTAYEVFNPNYGYGSTANTSLSKKVTSLTLNGTTQIKMNNTIHLGDLNLEKYDEDNSNIKLEDVGFVIQISPAPQKTYAYLALYNKDGKIVPSVKGTVTINRKNVATADGKEYKVSYYCTDKALSALSETEKANITTFVTESNGKLAVNNLEVYESKAGGKYTYKLIETSNSNYGFIVDSVELGNITIESNTTVNKQLGNDQVYTKISGYVWIENPTGKANGYDNVYTEGNTSNDTKLTDLYVIKNGKLIKNPEAATPVEIKLRDKTTKKFIKTLPDEFDKSGKYTFVDIEIEKLANYEVVFVYDGFYYTTVVQQLDKDNGSKVKEVTTERNALSNKFATVKDNNEVVSTDGTINKVEYYKDGHTSTVSELNFDTTVSANTTETGFELRSRFDAIKQQATKPVECIENVNMGIVKREQPKISINSDIYSVLVDFEGYKYNYEYNGRQDYYENKNGDGIGVKFEQENTEKRYTRTVYASDVQAAKDQNKEIKVAVTYKIQIANESKTLSVMPKQLINYFDARYDIKAIGLGFNETTHTITNALKYSEAKKVDGHPEYKSTVIDFNQTIVAANSNIKDLYITFDVQRDAILDLLNEKSTYHNATEILSYASYYAASTSIDNGKQFMTDKTAAGKTYAGIDKMSQPGNMDIALVAHPSGDGTKILDTRNFEDDTTSAPSLLLEAAEERKVSGIIFEDKATTESQAIDEKLGNGIFEQSEKPIRNVKVGLYKLNNDGTTGDIATYSNNEQAVTTTDENGNYTFGYYDEANKKHVGVLPGRYVIKYTYNNESYIVGKEAINVNDYKSTIITSQVIKNAFNGGNEKWYLIQEPNRYSDARDNIELRKLLDKQEVKYSNYADSFETSYVMDAYTPVMDIGLEFTEANEADALSLEFIRELKNVDFGIIERPDVDITIEKEITELEITAQNGTNIIPKGDPSDPEGTMPYVKKLDGLVSIELEESLLQGARLNLEYTITVKNDSDIDYEGESYYFYGTGRNTVRSVQIKKVADYLQGNMVIDTEKTQESGNEWQEATANELLEKGLISRDVYNELKDENYKLLITEQFNEITSGKEKTMQLYTTKYLAASDVIQERNAVEIIELSGGRTIKVSIPGNYVPSEQPNEPDEDRVDLIITPPTGTTINYTMYIIAAAITFIVLVSGIIIIKKKILK